MIIRGIDFARHNVIVAAEADTPAPQATPGTQQRVEAVARVLAVTGSEAVLDMNGQRVVVETHVPLNTGDKLNVLVSDGPNGQLRLSILSSGPDEGTPPALLATTDVDELLRSLGMPTDDRTRNAARALLARDGALEKPALQSLLADLKGFKAVTPKEAQAGALLQRAGVPINPATVAVVASRSEPNAPVQLGAKLLALAPELEALRKTLSPRSAQAAAIDAVLETLKGLPLDENATEPRVSAALASWLKKLAPDQPAEPKPTTFGAQGRAPGAPDQGGSARTTAQGGATPGQGGPDIRQGGQAGQGGPGTPPVPTDAERPSGIPGRPAAALEATVATAEAALEALADEPLLESEAAEPHAQGAKAPGPKNEPAAERPESTRPDPAKPASNQALERDGRVSGSQHFLARVGITTKVPVSAGSDLASTLERLGKSLGPEHQRLTSAITETVAELRYAQLANSPAPAANGMEFMIPLLVPQLSSEHPEGRIQVFHKQAKEGEPIDPNNVRLVFVLETEHLSTVQADVTIKDGVVDLSLGVPDAENRQFLAKHLDQLAAAIGKQGFSTGRFATRVAKAPPPKVRQEEGLTDIVRFDRRV